MTSSPKDDRDRAMRLQGAARMLSILTKHYHQPGVTFLLMETMGVTIEDLEQACEPAAEGTIDRLAVTRADVAELRAALEKNERDRRGDGGSIA
jgi:hypothetical protein